MENYKLRHIISNLSVEINKKTTNGIPSFKSIYESIKQILGRMTRIDKYSNGQIRIVEISKKSPYPDLLFLTVFIPNALKIFKKVYLIDIEKYETLSFSLVRSKNLNIFFNKYYTCVKETNIK